MHHPGHMVESDLARLLAGCVLADLDQRNLVRLVEVGRHERGLAGIEGVSVQTEQVAVPLVGTLDVAYIDVNMTQMLRLVTHRFSSGHDIRQRSSDFVQMIVNDSVFAPTIAALLGRHVTE